MKKVRFKVRVFLWKIIVWPVFMMLFSLAGPYRGMTADKNIELILKRAQISLKKFTFSPRNAGCEWFVRILNTKKEEIHLRLNKIEKDTEKHVREKIPCGEFLQILFCVVKKVGNVREYHPEIDWILRTVNNYYCSIHEQDFLTTHHLTHSHWIILDVDSLMS